MRIMGVDPGMTRCGIGVIDAVGGRRVSIVAVDVARTKPEMAPHQRLLIISNAIEEAIALYRPDVVAVERVFAQENVRSVTGTAQVAGIVMLGAAKASLPLGMHTPSEVKAAVTGNGRAEKAQVQLMVQRILGLSALPRPKDAADALAIAICHAWRGALSISNPWIVPSTAARACCHAQRATTSLPRRSCGPMPNGNLAATALSSLNAPSRELRRHGCAKRIESNIRSNRRGHDCIFAWPCVARDGHTGRY